MLSTCFMLSKKARDDVSSGDLDSISEERLSDFSRNIEFAAVACLNQLSSLDKLSSHHGFSPAGHLLRCEDEDGKLDMWPVHEAIQSECAHFLSAQVVHTYLQREWSGGRLKWRESWRMALFWLIGSVALLPWNRALLIIFAIEPSAESKFSSWVRSSVARADPTAGAAYQAGADADVVLGVNLSSWLARFTELLMPSSPSTGPASGDKEGLSNNGSLSRAAVMLWLLAPTTIPQFKFAVELIVDIGSTLAITFLLAALLHDRLSTGVV